MSMSHGIQSEPAGGVVSVRVVEYLRSSTQHDERAPTALKHIRTEPPISGYFNTPSKTVLSAYQEWVVESCR
jgi:hypothetical protein